MESNSLIIFGIVVLFLLIGLIGANTPSENGDHETLVYYPSNITILKGTYNYGTLDSFKCIDTDNYSIQEVTGAPGYDIRINFTNINKFNAFYKKSFYSGATTHYKTTELYDCSNKRWDIFDSDTTGFTYTSSYYPVSNSTKYVCNGLVQARIHHPTTGSSVHYILIDKWVLMET